MNDGSTALACSGASMLAGYSQPDDVLAAFGASEDDALKPSRLDLLQPIQVADEQGLTAGKFRDARSNIQFDSINVVPILIREGRVLFPPGGELGAKPICRSNDGKFPIISEDIVRQDAGNGCAKCPKAQFVRVGGKVIRSECNQTMSLLIAELETQMVYRYNAKGMALGPMKDLRETIAKMFRAAKLKGEYFPPYAMTFGMTSVKIKGAKGTYYVPKFTPTGRVNPNDVPYFEHISNKFTRTELQEDEAETASPVAKALDGEYVGTPNPYEEA